MDSRWISSPFALSCGLRREHPGPGCDGEAEAAVRRAPAQALARRQATRARREVAGRWAAPAAVDQHRQRTRRPAEVEQLVEHGADRCGRCRARRRPAGWAAPSIEGQARGDGCRLQAARAEVVAVQRAGSRRARRQPRSRLQPLGQPGAARPDADQHAPRVGLQQARTPRRSAYSLRRQAPWWHSAGACRNCLEDDRRRRRRRHRARRRPAFGGGVALVDLVHRQPEAAMQLARETLRARVLSCARRRDDGHPTTSASGCHSAISGADRPSARVAPRPGGAVAAWPGACTVSCRPATPTRRVPKSKASKVRLRGPVQRGEALRRAPPPGDSMRGSMPSSDSARS